MSKKFAVKHNLDTLSKEELVQYLRDVSEFIGLDPDLNGLDTIWMTNETGPGRALVVYARRGTAEILRNIYGVEVESLTYAQINSSIVFTATGRAKARDNRQEIAIGAKSIAGLNGKDLDDSIMTASTRSLRRLTMQFTTLGILDESEIVALLGHAPNPAGSVLPAANPTPPIFTAPQVPANNAPGKVVVELTAKSLYDPTQTEVIVASQPFVGQQNQIDEAWKQQADKKADTFDAGGPPNVKESVTSKDLEPAKEPAKKPRKPRKTVSLEVEPEVVSKPTFGATTPIMPPAAAEIPPAIKMTYQPGGPVPLQVNSAVPPQVNSVPAPPPPVEQPQAQPVALPAGLPTPEQMEGYRAHFGVFTQQLPPSEGMDAVKKMRAFITYLSGTIPQNMTVAQWEEVQRFFANFMVNNSMKNLVKYINDSLAVK